MLPQNPTSMRNITLTTEETLAHSNAFIFVLEHWVELLKAGHGDTEFSFGNQSMVTYASDNNVVVGSIVWGYDPARRAATEILTAVAKSYRRQGIYTSMITEVMRRAKLKGAVNIFSGVAVTNLPMLEHVAKAERNPNWVRTKKSLR